MYRNRSPLFNSDTQLEKLNGNESHEERMILAQMQMLTSLRQIWAENGSTVGKEVGWHCPVASAWSRCEVLY